MSRCPSCHHENPRDAKFCLECGRRLAPSCGACGTELPGGAKFCKECGQAVGAATPLTAARVGTLPESYTPKHLAEKILTSKAALEGERKQVTVLFADLKGSMELLADRDPEEARKLLDPVLECMMEAVHRYEGTVNQVMGDGIMALFGAPLAHEDHAVRACYAALRMQESVKRYAEEVRRLHGVTVQIRVGLNSGGVVVRSIGSDLHMDYTAVGQTTHLAARMEQLAPPSTILLTPHTLDLAEGWVEVKPLGPVPVKGIEEPVEVYELMGAGAARSRLQAAAGRGLTRFVGRTAEMEQLSQALERARAGHGQMVAVVGEPGVGKSRLYWEFTRSHRIEGALIVESASVSYGKAAAYLPVIDLLKAYFQIEGRDDTRKIREKVTGKVLSLDRQLEPSLPALLSLLDVPVDDAQWERLDPPQRRQRTLDGVKHLLLRESQVQPLLVLFEDLHWIDTETQTLLDSLVETLPTARLLLLVNYRPEYQHGWGSKTYYRQLRVDPLPAESADDLLGSLLGANASLEPLKRTLIERTEGNPLFLEESVRALVETRTLIGERGAYRLAQDPRTIQVPATVQAILAARIDRLSPEDKRLLQAAAVVGKDLPFTLLQAVSELPEEALRQGLARLQTAEFLYEAHLFPDLEYTFKHALTHEVAYGSLLQDRRRTLHARIVEALERLYPDRLTEQVDRLAHHAFRGELWDRAVIRLRQAGAKAMDRSAHREAMASFEQALAALAHLSETREVLEQAIDLRSDLRSSLLPQGEIRRIIEHLQQAEALAASLGDQQRLGRVSADMALHSFLAGDLHQGVEAGRRALAIATELGDFAVEIQANFHLGQLYWALGDYRQAIEFLRRNVAALQGERARERFGLPFHPSVDSRCYLAFCLAELGLFTEGITLGEEGIQIATVVDNQFSLTAAYRGLGLLYLRKGDFHRAIPVLEHALGVCQQWNIDLLFASVASPLGSAYTAAGRIAEAMALLEQAVQRDETMGLTHFHTFSVAALSDAHLRAGRINDAIALGGRALDLSNHRRERGVRAYVLRLLGEIASRRDPPNADEAESYYREAVSLASELSMLPLLGHCHLGLGNLYRRTGKRQEAQQHLATATTLYREMDMRFWLEQAEAEMRELA